MAWRRASDAPDQLDAETSTRPQEDKRTLSAQEASVDAFAKRSVALLGGSTLAHSYPLVRAALGPLLLVHTWPLFREAAREIRDDEVGGGVIRALSAGGMLWSGAFGILAFSSVMFAVTDKLQLMARRRAMGDLNLVFGELPRTAWVRRDDLDVEVALEELDVGDLVVVSAGEIIPVDGIIDSGEASINQQALTGEAQPVEKWKGDSVLAATIVLSGQILVRVERTGKDTAVASIEDILRRTADYSSTIELKGKEIADRTALPTLALAGVTLPLLGSDAAVCMLAVYPGEGMRALGPLSLLNYIHHAARNRVLIKDGRALESLQDVDTVVFDKTGTLTETTLDVTCVHTFRSMSANKVLGLAATAEVRQQHPIARAIRNEAAVRQLDLPAVDESSYQLGLGVKVNVEGQRILVGSRRFLHGNGLVIPAKVERLQSSVLDIGNSLVHVALNDRVIGAIELAPRIRPEVKPLVRALQARGLEVYIMSGDHELPTARLAAELGVDHHIAESLPDQKASQIEAWRAEGKTVCFVGDGINDSIALRTANVSVSLSGASLIASDTANVVLLDGDLTRMPMLFDLANDLKTNMRTNLIVLLAPSPILLFGIYMLGFRYLATMYLVSLSGFMGIANATLGAKHRLAKLDAARAKITVDVDASAGQPPGAEKAGVQPGDDAQCAAQ
jgi:Cu2+-exporting ATPase